MILLAQAQNILNRLIEMNITTPDSFEWLGQMRYYFDDNTEIAVEMIKSKILYGFEYIGNKTRMVVTPLTDRCYRAMFVGLNNHFGLALQVVNFLRSVAIAIITIFVTLDFAGRGWRWQNRNC